MPVLVSSHIRQVIIRDIVVQRLIQQLLVLIRESESEVSIKFVGDIKMRRLNREYRGNDRTTDVLAFAFREAGGPFSPMLGDVVISIPMARRQAKSFGHSLSEELVRLFIHGVLHLVGYDHERSEADARSMKKKEMVLWKRVSPIPKLVKGKF